MNQSKALEALQRVKNPQTIEAVRVAASIGNWETAKAILLELLAEGKIKGMRTSSSWVFWLESPE